MEISERQKELKRKKNFWGIFSFSIMIITTIVMVILAIKNCFPHNPNEETGGAIEVLDKVFSEEVKTAVLSLAVTAGIFLVITIIIRDKFRTFMWLVDLFIAVYLFDRIGMFIIGAIWIVDEYIFRQIYLSTKKKYEIRKEIDY